VHVVEICVAPSIVVPGVQGATGTFA